MTTPKRMGAMIERLREGKGMTQAAPATWAQISREYVNRIEGGQHDPTVGTLTRIAKALGVPVMELLE